MDLSDASCTFTMSGSSAQSITHAGAGAGGTTTLLSQDFSSISTGAVTTSSGTNPYQIDNNSGCGSLDKWNISTSNATGTSCSGCSGTERQ